MTYNRAAAIADYPRDHSTSELNEAFAYLESLLHRTRSKHRRDVIPIGLIALTIVLAEREPR